MSNSPRANTTTVAIALLVAHEDNFLAVLDFHILEDLRRGARFTTIGRRSVRQRDTESPVNQSVFHSNKKREQDNILVEYTRRTTATVVQESHTISDSLLGIVKGLATPVAQASVHRGSTTVSTVLGLLLLDDIGLGGRDLLPTVPGVLPGDLLAVDEGGDHVANTALLLSGSLPHGITDLLLLVEVAVAVTGTALVRRGFRITLGVGEASSRNVVSELFEVERSTEMPGDL